MELRTVAIRPSCELILGQGNFSLKTVADIYNALLSAVPGIKVGVAMNDGSARVVRSEGNDEELKKEAVSIAKEVGSGHLFVVCMKGAFPINVLPYLKAVPGVVTLFAATSNPVVVVVAEEGDQRAVIGVMDGYAPQGEENREERLALLKKLGYL